MKPNQVVKIVLFLGLAATVFAGPKLAKDLPAANATGSGDIILQFKTLPTADDLKQLGPYGQTKKIFNTIKAVQISVSPSVLTILEAMPNVKYISPNRQNKSFLDLTTSAVNANVAWPLGWDGTGVGVAVIDSGIALKRDLTGPDGITSRVIYSESFVTGQTAEDVYGHGTHVAGIVGSSGKNSGGLLFTRTFKGVAPNVNLINLRVLDANGGGTESGVIAAIERAIALQSTYNIRVINLSLGRQVFESYTLDPLCQAVEAAWKAGIVVVTAAGNYGRDNSTGTSGYGTIASPGNDPYAITVGAMNTKGTFSTADDAIASYSSKGPTLVDHLVKPDLVAPGNGVVSLMAPNNTLAALYPTTLISASTYQLLGFLGQSSDYFRLSGTSMAAPVVSAAAALLIQQQPSLTPDQVKARLMKTATKAINLYSTGIGHLSGQRFNNQADIFTVGAGYLNISAALANHEMASMPALSPRVARNPISGKINMLRDFSVVWGDSMVWGDSAVFGNTVFFYAGVTATDDSIVWGDSMVWGDSTTAGFTIVWGDSVLTGASMLPFAIGDEDQ
jgi:Subtilisin-like serine proteases